MGCVPAEPISVSSGLVILSAACIRTPADV
jgi:hypothetical protein